MVMYCIGTSIRIDVSPQNFIRSVACIDKVNQTAMQFPTDLKGPWDPIGHVRQLLLFHWITTNCITNGNN